MTSDIDKLAEQIFEQQDDLPNEITPYTRVWIGLVEVHDVPLPIIGFSEADLERKSSGLGRLVWSDYYYDGLTAILSDSVEALWEYAYSKAENKIKKESEE